MLNLYSKNRRQREADHWRGGAELVTGHDRFSRRLGAKSLRGSSPATFATSPKWRRQKLLQRKKRREEVAGLEVSPTTALSTTVSSFDVAGQLNNNITIGSPLLSEGPNSFDRLVRRFQELLCLRHDDYQQAALEDPLDGPGYQQLTSNSPATSTK